MTEIRCFSVFLTLLLVISFMTPLYASTTKVVDSSQVDGEEMYFSQGNLDNIEVFNDYTPASKIAFETMVVVNIELEAMKKNMDTFAFKLFPSFLV